ncbi:O-antigen ligase family protein [candidate division WOR-3 bacterium]|nr:O-antigen ligase family protein [candidate division WOR-3 bacterium]
MNHSILIEKTQGLTRGLREWRSSHFSFILAIIFAVIGIGLVRAILLERIQPQMFYLLLGGIAILLFSLIYPRLVFAFLLCSFATYNTFFTTTTKLKFGGGGSFWVTDIIMFLLFIGMGIKMAVRKDSMPRTPLNVPLLLFYTVVFVAALRGIFYSVDPVGSMGRLRFLSYYLLFFPFIYFFKDTKQIRQVFYFWIAVAVVAAILSIIRYIQAPSYKMWMDPTGGFWTRRLRGPVAINAVTPMLLMLVSVFIYYREKFSKFVLSFVILLLLICLGISYTRGHWLEFMGGLLYIIAISGAKERTKRITIILLAGVFLIFGVILLGTLVPGQTGLGHFAFRFKTIFFPTPGGNIESRIKQSVGAIKALQLRPLFGCGFGGTYLKGLRMFGSYYGGVHNSFLLLALEMGFLGLGFFLWFIFQFLKDAHNLYKNLKEGWLKGFVLGTQGVMIGIILLNQSGYGLVAPRTGVLFAFVMGSVEIIRKIKNKQGL